MNKNYKKKKKEVDHIASVLYLHIDGGARCRPVFRGVLIPKKTPLLPLSRSVRNQSKYEATKSLPSALPGLTAPNCKLSLLIHCKIVFILIMTFVSLGLLLFV